MEQISMDEIDAYINVSMVDLQCRRIKALGEIKLDDLLGKNPFNIRANNILTAADLISGLLEAFLSSSEEKLFGDFLEELAVFIADKTCAGHKSTAPGIDLEFINNGVYYVVSVKSGPNWGNSSQQKKLEEDLRTAVARLKQSKHAQNIQPVLGICYGKTRTAYLRGYMKVVGQNFWYLISENRDLYLDIIEPIGYRAREHNQEFEQELSGVKNNFTRLFIERFCDETGRIDWPRLVQFNSGNFDLDHYMS